jgi:hypothetical protein
MNNKRKPLSGLEKTFASKEEKKLKIENLSKLMPFNDDILHSENELENGRFSPKNEDNQASQELSSVNLNKSKQL